MKIIHVNSFSNMLKLILHKCQSIEPKFRINAHFLKNDPEVNSKMRAVLVDWLVQVQVISTLIL